MARATASLPLRDALVIEAKHNPWRLFTLEEIALIVDKGINFVKCAKKEGAPFPGNVTRPEWIAAWLLAHPDFQSK